MGIIGAPEAIVIIVVIAIFFFGKDKIIEWAKSLGEAKKAFGDSSSGKTKPETKKPKKKK